MRGSGVRILFAAPILTGSTLAFSAFGGATGYGHAEIEVIRSALIEGEKSGKPKRLDAPPSSVGSAAYMAEYRFSPAAERDVEGIWKYCAESGD